MAKRDVALQTSAGADVLAGVVAMGAALSRAPARDATFYPAAVGGVLLVVLGAYAAWAAATGRGQTALFPSAAASISGIWLATFPWFVVVTDAYFYATVSAGVLAAVASAYGMAAASRAPARTA